MVVSCISIPACCLTQLKQGTSDSSQRIYLRYLLITECALQLIRCCTTDTRPTTLPCAIEGSVKSILFVAATCRGWKQLMSDISILIDIMMFEAKKVFWRVPSSKALSCKHERLFHLLTLASSYQNQLIHRHQLIALRQQLICDLQSRVHGRPVKVMQQNDIARLHILQHALSDHARIFVVQSSGSRPRAPGSSQLAFQRLFPAAKWRADELRPTAGDSRTSASVFCTSRTPPHPCDTGELYVAVGMVTDDMSLVCHPPDQLLAAPEIFSPTTKKVARMPRLCRPSSSLFV